jgi:heterodisulfide reductase subunit A
MGVDQPMANTDPDIRIGVFVCRCGINIAGVLNTSELAQWAKKLPNVVIAEENLSYCTTAGADAIKKQVKEHKLNRVVVAACTPKTHEPVFRAVLKDCGLDQSYLEFVNIREQNSFVHQKAGELGFDKAKNQIRAGAARAAKLEAVPEKVVPITSAALVIGAGVGGIQSALDLANQGYKVFLVDDKPTIGGKMAMLDRTFPTDDCSI